MARSSDSARRTDRRQLYRTIEEGGFAPLTGGRDPSRLTARVPRPVATGASVELYALSTHRVSSAADMPDDRTSGLPPERLAEVVAKLDQVMVEAQRLRREVTRQLAEQRGGQRQEVSPTRRKTSSKPRRSG
jgi:hypothetical protein